MVRIEIRGPLARPGCARVHRRRSGAAPQVITAGLPPVVERTMRVFIREVGRGRVERMGHVLAAADLQDRGPQPIPLKPSEERWPEPINLRLTSLKLINTT